MPVVFSFVMNVWEVIMARKSAVAPVILLGLGKVGRALVNLVIAGRDQLEKRRGITIRLLGVADSTGAFVDPDGLTDPDLGYILSSKSEGGTISELPGSLSLGEITAVLRPGTIIVDATASETTSPMLIAALANGCGVVLANKRPLVLPWEEAKVFYTHPCVGYEATVGAGLPVISTLRALLDTGDRITAIDGLVSGTLGYLLSEVEDGTPYSVALSRAHASGYTEPDPRDDLSGMDVARKGVILARTAGWPLELDDLPVTPLYPPELAALPVQEFMRAAARLDEEYARKAAQARSKGKALRYLVRVSPTGGEVGLTAVDQGSALARLHGAENAVVIKSEFYREIPLSVCGPGAGPRVTASGVLKDITEIAIELRKEKG